MASRPLTVEWWIAQWHDMPEHGIRDREAVIRRHRQSLDTMTIGTERRLALHQDISECRAVIDGLRAIIAEKIHAPTRG